MLSNGAAERPAGVDQHRPVLDAERIPPRDGGGVELEIAQVGLDDRSEDLLPLLEIDHSTIVIFFSDLQKDRLAVGPESPGRKRTIVSDIFDRTSVTVRDRGQPTPKIAECLNEAEFDQVAEAQFDLVVVIFLVWLPKRGRMPRSVLAEGVAPQPSSHGHDTRRAGGSPSRVKLSKRILSMAL